MRPYPRTTEAQQDMIDRVLTREKDGTPLSPAELAEHTEALRLINLKNEWARERLARMRNAS